MSVEPFERLLRDVVRRPRASAGVAKPETLPAPRPSALEALSPEKRALLALRLRKRTTTGDRWFPGAGAERTPDLRLFAFPHAGGGTGTFAGWQARLGEVRLCPARLPGRESRTGEPALEAMEPLVDALAAAIRPYLDTPFAFFGHSMGAAVAFELARRLRDSGRPGPLCLIAAAARAPRFRLNHVPPPDPGDEELLRQVRSLEGVSTELLDNPDLLAVILPALRADTRLYRHYVYREAPPLDCPIFAYGGTADPNVGEEHLSAWALETSGRFAMRAFPGGHFFPRAALDAFLETLAQDLRASQNVR